MGPLRLASHHDLAAVTACITAAFQIYVARIGKPPAPMLADYSPLIAASRVYLQDGAGAPAGVIVIEPRADHLFVETVAVRPGEQGRGRGRLLMGFAEREARRLGLGEIQLYTHEKMEETFPFYAALGYEETERREEGGYARVYFRKRIDKLAEPA